MSGKQLGFIGVGTMGHHMAGRLLEAGYSLIIFDTNETAMQRLEQRGAKRATSPADVASQCETILVSLPTPDVVKAVAYGKNGVTEGSTAKVFVDLSTTGSNAASPRPSICSSSTNAVCVRPARRSSRARLDPH